MSTDYGDFEDYRLGTRVVITAGELAGETGVIGGLGFYDENHVTDLIIALDKRPGDIAMVTPSMVDTLDDSLDDFYPKVPRQGMTSDQTAQTVEEFMRFCQSRVRGVGAEQYGQETHQKFEAMSVDELFECTVEELADIVNYATFLYVRFNRIRAAWEQYL